MPRTLITLGLALIAAWILLQVVTYAVKIALGAGVLLVVIGVIWYFVQRPKKR
jgi:uncharacterized membrane protein YGL010W